MWLSLAALWCQVQSVRNICLQRGALPMHFIIHSVHSPTESGPQAHSCQCDLKHLLHFPKELCCNTCSAPLWLSYTYPYSFVSERGAHKTCMLRFNALNNCIFAWQLFSGHVGVHASILLLNALKRKNYMFCGHPIHSHTELCHVSSSSWETSH